MRHSPPFARDGWRGRLACRSADQTPAAFAQLHEQLWAAVTDSGIRAQDTAAAAERALALVPDDDDDAAAALTYALRAASGGDRQDAAWAAERVYNALDAFLQNQGLEVGSPSGEPAHLAHSLVQTELQRQADDLRALRALGAADVGPAALDPLRRRADAAAECIFG